MTIAKRRLAIERGADILFGLRLRRERLGSLPGECRPRDPTEGYAMQDLLLERLGADLGPSVGYKIGCTTRAMQTSLGVDHPCSGGLLASTVQRSPAVFRYGDLMSPGVECEVGVRLRADLRRAGPAFDREEVAEAVGSYVATIEIVEDRRAPSAGVDAATLIADNFFAAACVLGEPVSREDVDASSDLRAWLEVDGVQVAGAAGPGVLSGGLDALTWLANARAGLNDGLRAGELVLLGSLASTWLEGPAEVTARVERLGEARASIR